MDMSNTQELQDLMKRLHTAEIRAVLALIAVYEYYHPAEMSEDKRWGLEQVMAFLEKVDVSSDESLSQAIAGMLDEVGGWHAGGLISEEAYHAVFERLRRLPAVLRALQVPGPGTVDEAGSQQGCLAWEVQPPESPEIAYAAFEASYGLAHVQVEALIALLAQFRPDVPILNCTVEWAVLKQREMEALSMLDGAQDGQAADV
jgi:hypothetical protein